MKKTLAAISPKPEKEIYRPVLMLYAFTNTHM
jgi:hypothetical protein